MVKIRKTMVYFERLSEFGRKKNEKKWRLKEEIWKKFAQLRIFFSEPKWFKNEFLKRFESRKVSDIHNSIIHLDPKI